MPRYEMSRSEEHELASHLAPIVASEDRRAFCRRTMKVLAAPPADDPDKTSYELATLCAEWSHEGESPLDTLRAALVETRKQLDLPEITVPPMKASAPRFSSRPPTPRGRPTDDGSDPTKQLDLPEITVPASAPRFSSRPPTPTRVRIRSLGPPPFPP